MVIQHKCSLDINELDFLKRYCSVVKNEEISKTKKSAKTEGTIVCNIVILM